MSDDFNLDNVDFGQAEEALKERMNEIDNEQPTEADNDCGGSCAI